jgi:enoyl-CoA hydratase/carnithine racemase
MKKTVHGMDALPDSLHVERRGAVLVVRLTRSAKHNALNDAAILGLEHLFTHIPAEVGAVVLDGDGEHFCAGLDLSELRALDAVEGLHHSRMWHRAFQAIQFGSVPVVAALHGGVIGGGLELACAAHIRVAEPSTFYALPEGQRGIFVGGGGAVRIPRLIGVARMTDMMLTGRVVRADEGLQIGFSQYLVGDGEGFPKAMELAHTIAGNTRITNYALIQALPRIAEASPEQGLLLEALISSIAQSAPEAKARLDQFLNKQAKKVGEA